MMVSGESQRVHLPMMGMENTTLLKGAVTVDFGNVRVIVMSERLICGR